MRDAREKWEEVGRQRDAQKARDKPKGGRKKAEATGEGESEGRAHLPRSVVTHPTAPALPAVVSRTAINRTNKVPYS